MELDKRALDRYITREPHWMEEDERPALKCAKCGKFLKEEPDGTREMVSIRHCDGQAKVITCTWGENYSDENVLQIIGEEFRGKEYEVAYPPACGSMEGSRHQTYDGDIQPSDATNWTHEPHFFVEDVWGYVIYEIRLCKCGHYNEEPVQ